MDSLAAVYCPRCGTENRSENRYCIECGSELAQGTASAARLPARARLRGLLGTTRQARLLTAATILAAVLGIAAFIALKADSEGGPDAFMRSLDKACLEEKERIAALEHEATPSNPESIAAFATQLVALVEEWRLNLAQNPPPASHAEDVRLLDSRLREVLIEAGALARVAQAGDPRRVVSQARAVDETTRRADRAMEELGLTACSEFKIATNGS